MCWKQEQECVVVIQTKKLVFKHPGVSGGSPVDEALREPKSDLLLGRLLGVRAVNEIAANDLAEVTTNGARSRVGGLGSTKELATLESGIEAFPDHSDNRTRSHVVEKAVEERLASEISVVLLEVSASRSDELHRDELETLLFKSEN